MANRRYIDFPIAASVGNNDIVLIWQDGLNKQTTKETLLQGSPQSLAGLTDVDISALNNGQILQYNSTTSKWENVDRTDINLSELGDVTIVAPANGQVLVYNSSTSKWENSSGGYVPYTGAVTTVNLGAQTIQAGSFVKAGGTSAQFLKANGSVDSTVYGTGTVTSVALTMPSAFSVGGSPITTAGTLAVTGAGTVGQYIRGDGSLADFPATTGGGSSVSYYLNGSVSQGTIGGVAYREINRTPIFGAGTDITINADGYIASFITDALDPNKLLIPAGNWNLETYFSANSGGGSPTFYVELYKYNGTTFTLIATSSGTPELIAFGTNINPYFTTLAVPETVLALTDRLALRYYVTHSGRTITLHTENNHLCQVITTFTTGLTALNGLTNQVQYLTVGTSGTDFAISSASDTHTFNLPTASATNRGALSSADWTTFNGKQNALTNPVTGTGTSGQVAYFNGTSAITGESGLTWDATNDRLNIGAGTANSNLTVSGSDNSIIFSVLAGVNSRLHVGTVSSGTITYIRSQNNYALNLGVNTTDYLSISTAGNSSFSGNIILTTGANRYVRIGSSTAYYYDLQTTGDDFQIIEAGTTPRLTIKYPNGNIGINTTTPATTLEINGVALFSGTSLSGNTKNGVYIYDQSIISLAGGNARPLTIQSQTLSIFTGTTYSEKVKIFENGNVVISTSPSDAGFKLDVNGTGRFTSTLIATNLRSNGEGTFSFNTANNGEFQIYANSTGGMILAGRGSTYDMVITNKNGAETFRVLTGTTIANFVGNVGIGTTTPEIYGSGWGRAVGILASSGYSTIQVAGSSGNGGEIDFGNNTIRHAAIASLNGSDLNFYTNGTNSGTGVTERMRISSGGSIGINNTSPMNSAWGTDSSTKQLSIDASGYAVINLTGSTSRKYSMGVGDGNFYMCYDNTAGRHNISVTSGGSVLIGTTTDNGVGKLQISGGSVTVAGGVRFSSSGADANRWSVYWNGGTGDLIVVNNISDIRAKKDFDYNIKGLETIKKLKPLKFTWKDGTSHSTSVSGRLRQYGFIAQETMQADDYLAWYNQSQDTWGIEQYESFSAVIVKAIQEQQEIINDLKQKIK